MSLRQAVLRSYKQLLRAQRKRFVGDAEMLASAAVETKNQYLQHKNESDANVIQTLIHNAEEATDFILHGMVQGVLQDSGNYELKYEEEHTIKDEDSKNPLKDPTA